MRLAGPVVAGALALVACSKNENGDSAPAVIGDDDTVRCLLPGMKAFEPVCRRETAQGPDGPIWILRHPDGGFRRFVLMDKGMRIAAADGTQEVSAKQRGPDLEVRVSNDRYLFAAAANAPLR